MKMQTFPSIYKQGLTCLTSVIKHEGCIGLYRGITPSVVASVTDGAVIFMTYGICQDIVKKLFQVQTSEQMTDFQNACTGAMTGFAVSFAICPIELVKCRLQATQEMATIAAQEAEMIHRCGPYFTSRCIKLHASKSLPIRRMTSSKDPMLFSSIWPIRVMSCVVL